MSREDVLGVFVCACGALVYRAVEVLVYKHKHGVLCLARDVSDHY